MQQDASPNKSTCLSIPCWAAHIAVWDLCGRASPRTYRTTRNLKLSKILQISELISLFISL